MDWHSYRTWRRVVTGYLKKKTFSEKIFFCAFSFFSCYLVWFLFYFVLCLYFLCFLIPSFLGEILFFWDFWDFLICLLLFLFIWWFFCLFWFFVCFHFLFVCFFLLFFFLVVFVIFNGCAWDCMREGRGILLFFTFFLTRFLLFLCFLLFSALFSFKNL